jgi:tetratricopeptide (TPR) repeat protein
MGRLESDNNKSLAQNEKLQQDALSFVNSNSKLQQEKEETAKMLEAAKTLLKRKEVELNQAKQKLADLNVKISTQQENTDSGLAKEKKDLESHVSTLEATLKKERALFHYNLAVAYTKSKLYDDAIESYEKSLALNPNNADAHYNLGLLYSDVKNNPEKAAKHYKKYLELKPNAEDRDEVQDWIDKLR